MELTQIRDLALRIKENVKQVIVGKDYVMDLLLVGLLSSGHILLEDVPGTGKTLLAKALAKSLGCTFRRIQFTPDLLPADLTGIHFYNQKNSEFQFRPGPIFSNILLADEINRATPRTQSSLLECMEERQVSTDGETRQLERPFLVIATQNPVDNHGTFPLPEAQLDRFMLKVNMGYPSTNEAVEILKRFRESSPLDELVPVADAEEIVAAQNDYSSVYVSEDMLQYIVSIIERTRTHQDIVMGVSPRGSQSLLKAAQVYAILAGRDFVVPDDIKAMAIPVLSHRMMLKNTVRMRDHHAQVVLEQILQEISVPTEVNLHKGSVVS